MRGRGVDHTATLARRVCGAAFLVGMLFVATAARADITVRATVSPQRAQVGETLTLSIEINGAQNVSAPALATIDGFDIQYAGPSTQVSIMNGQISAAVHHRYSLLAMREGHFTIGPFTVDYQGKQYQTAALSVDIVAAGQPAQAPQGPGAPAAGARTANSPRSLRLTLTVPKQEVYLHERLPLDVTLYVGSIRVADVQYPTVASEGLSLDKFAEPSQRQQVIDGEAFQVLHFQTTVIPLRAGTLTLGPANLQLNVLNRRRDQFSNDPFFERFFQDDPFTTERRPLNLHSDPLTLTVLPLPEEGKPPGFSGAVGSFAMQVSAAPTELNAGDPITVRITLNGSGNLADAGPPELSSAEGFRTYEPHAGKADGGGSGINKTFEQVLIPNDATVRAIPSVRFAYFDPQARRYQTVQSEPIALTVRAPKNAPRDEIVAVVPGVRAAPEETLGHDIVYIKDDPGGLVPRSAGWSRRLPFLLWQPVPLVLFVAAAWYDRRRQRLSGDVRYARFSRAGKEARRGLATAEQALAHGDREAFYDALSRTMQAYLGAKLDLPPGGIDEEAVRVRGVPHDCVQQIAAFFTTCEQVRFAPGAGDGDMRGTLALARDVIERLERERRLNRGSSFGRVAKRGVAAAWLLVAATVTIGHAAEEAPASPQTTFFHANALYKDDQYAAAAKEYEELVGSGLESGNLYFNLGNAYFKAGEKGKAILNYERARRFMPSDPDLLANLAFAQSVTGVEPCVPPLWQRLVFPLAYRMSTTRLMWAASGFYTLLLVGLAAHRLWLRRPRWLVYAATGLALLVLIATSSLAQQALSEDWRRQGVIVRSGETAARFEPAENGTVHFVVKEGATVHVLDQREGWLQIARCDGRRGWVEKQAVESLQIAD